MNTKKVFIKRLSSFALSMAVIGGASAITYANVNKDTSTKNVVVTAQGQKANKNNKVKGTISDEKAVQMATKAIKDYMGIDASYFSQTKIDRQKNESSEKGLDDKKKQEIIDGEKAFLKVHPEKAKDSQAVIEKVMEMTKHEDDMITVSFTRADGISGTNFVDIDETTGEIVNVTAVNNLNSNSACKVDNTKVKNAALDFLKKTGKDADVDLDSISIGNNGPMMDIDFKLKKQSGNFKDADTIRLEVNSQNYTVVHYDNYSDTYNK